MATTPADLSEKTEAHAAHHDDLVVEGFETDAHQLRPGYFRSSFFVGSMAAMALGLWAGVAGFGYAAPILTEINNDLGPDPNIVWVSLTYTLTSAVFLTIIGRVSDIFGRRWVFIGGAAFGLVGSIVAATAQNVGALIAGSTIIGIGASAQLSYYYVMGEIVPMEYRFAGNGFLYFFCIPGSGVAPVIGQAFITHYSVSWRGVYYILIGVNGLGLLCWVLFYHPPTFEMKHRNASKMEFVKHFDYIGTVLYLGGLLIFVLGLSWGGVVYPWKSGYVIGTLVAGAVGLIVLGFWETFMPLKEPLIRVRYFRNVRWSAAVVVSGLGASMYYALALIWPQMVGVLYAGGSSTTNGWLSSLIGLGIIAGQAIGGCAAKYIRHFKLQCTVTLILSGIFFACMATSDVDSKGRSSTIMALGVFFVGWAESLAITMITLSVENQQELGSAGGLAGSVRFLIVSIASTIYTVVLNNRLAKTVASEVPPALVNAGLPSASVPQFLAGLTSGNMTGIPGLTPDITAAGTMAYKQANVDAFRTVFLVTIAFTGIAILASFLLPRVESVMTSQVAATLHGNHTPQLEEGKINDTNSAVAYLYHYGNPLSLIGVLLSSPSSSSTMSVTHTVLFQFKEDADPEKVKATCKHFLSLKTGCIHPTTQAPYVLSIKGGKDNSPEGLQNGITHGFVVEFSSLEHRDYYVKTDPAHQAFVKTLDNLVVKAIVVDFVNEEY
ncbi:Fungal trichothecene efflux pump [Niveomyces insectorum RCEF 264]|uniref:Fungal trichothecene efflux pump n=1 Tax=Niveomyces insectorum RCEF 264 TaxID=1081102 RepID=A0A167T9Q2_9HYPO|nr:Fungal trichothecene efflux pump [Niveomyces insectorum RCEF 264]